jgi:hypothetical protein
VPYRPSGRLIPCPICGNLFHRKYLRRDVLQTTCSRECSTKIEHESKCHICGTLFKHRGRRHWHYCSQTCKEKSRYINRGRITRCEICRQAFLASNRQNRVRFCSQECSGIYSRLYESELNYRFKAFVYRGLSCEICGNTDQQVLVGHHKDNNRRNHTIENLQVICANCHHRHHWSKSKKLQLELEKAKKARIYLFHSEKAFQGQLYLLI